MFEAGFTYILSKSLMNTRTKNKRHTWVCLLFLVRCLPLASDVTT